MLKRNILNKLYNLQFLASFGAHKLVFSCALAQLVYCLIDEMMTNLIFNVCNFSQVNLAKLTIRV